MLSVDDAIAQFNAAEQQKNADAAALQTVQQTSANTISQAQSAISSAQTSVSDAQTKADASLNAYYSAATVAANALLALVPPPPAPPASSAS